MSKEKKSSPKIDAKARYRTTERDITARMREEENLRRMATVVMDSNDAITIQDFEGRITAWNRGAKLMYGYNEEEALLSNIDLLTTPGKVEEQKDFIRRLIAGEAITSFETQRVTKDGRILDVWMTVTKLMDDAGKPVGLASIERDITARKREIDSKARYRITERDITSRNREEENLRRMATVVMDSNDAITIQDFEGRITAWNRGAEIMYGYNEEEALLSNINLLTTPGKVEEQKDFIRRLIAGEAITSFETQRVTKDGRILDVWMTVTKLMDDAGKPVGLASTERDITARKREEEKVLKLNAELEQRVVERTAQLEAANKELEHHAMHDSLTGIFNRRAILDRLKEEISRAKREKRGFSVGMCDIDHFKKVNDTYGHQTGDEVLIAFTQCALTQLREYDYLGRYGGEEFLVIAGSKGKIDENPYERLRSEVAKTEIQTKAAPISITVSIGVASGTGQSTADDLLAAADAALYQAKANGRNRVVHYRRVLP